MTKILYKQYNIENNVIKSFSKSKEGLKSAASASSSMSFPGDFEYQSYLADLPVKLNDLLTQYNKIESWLNDSILCFEDACATIKEDFDTFIPVEILADTKSINELY